MVDIAHPESREHCMEVFRRVLSGEKVDRVEAVFVTRDGKNITVEGSVNRRFKEGRPVSTRGSLFCSMLPGLSFGGFDHPS